MIVVVILIIQLLLILLSIIIGLISAIPFALIFVVVVVVDILNGNASSPTHDLIMTAQSVVQSVVQFIGNINFG
jgi:hypothetical protein